jgi:hypothetical protein
MELLSSVNAPIGALVHGVQDSFGHNAAGNRIGTMAYGFNAR